MRCCELTATILVVSATLLRSSDARRHDDQPHIIYIMADDLGWHDTSFNADLLGELDDVSTRDWTTPNIDRLANSGIKLANYYTIAICTPSRVALLTGRQPLESGMHVGVATPGSLTGIPLDMPVISEHMQDLGYETHMGGKWHVGYSNVEQTPIGRGFDDFTGWLLGQKNHFSHDTDVTGNTFFGGFQGVCECNNADPSTANFTATGQNGFDYWHGDASDQTLRSVAQELEGVYDTDIVTDYIIEKIEGRCQKPLFLYASYSVPHDPWQAPDRFTSMPECAVIADVDRAQLCGMMKSIDDAVGRIVSTLQREQIDDNTLIVFTSDNGAAIWIPYHNERRIGSNWPLRGGKTMHFEGGTRAPGFIWGDPVLHGSSRLDGGGATYENTFHVSDWSLTLQAAAGSRGPTEYFGKEFNGERYLSSASHWNALTELNDVGSESAKWVWNEHSESWQRRDSAPRGDSQLMLYHYDNDNVAAARNNDYKLYRAGGNLRHDGYFDPSNATREAVICASPLEPLCSTDRTLPLVIMFKISEDPLEQNTIDATVYDALTTEEQAAFDELSAYLDYWGNIAQPSQLGPDPLAIQFNDCDAAPELHECVWSPWLDSADPNFALAAFGLATEQTCRLNNAFNDPECQPNRYMEWQQYAASG